MMVLASDRFHLSIHFALILHPTRSGDTSFNTRNGSSRCGLRFLYNERALLKMFWLRVHAFSCAR